MRTGRKLFSLILGAATLPLFISTSARADTLTTLHLDVNCISITSVPDASFGQFSSTFTGSLNFTANTLTNMSADIDSSFQGDLDITGFSGSIHFVNGELDSGVAGDLDCGQITVSVAGPGALTDSYTYDVEGGTGFISEVHSLPGHPSPGYRLSGDTENGIFDNTNFGGVDVTTWQALQPLLGSFFEFNYHPNSVTGVDMNAQVEVNVYALTPSGGSPVPLPTSLMGGLPGVGMLGVYRWRHVRNIKRNG